MIGLLIVISPNYELFDKHTPSFCLFVIGLLMLVVIICLHCLNRIKYLYVANMLIPISAIIYGIFLFLWNRQFIALFCIGFGISVGYTLHIKKAMQATTSREVKNLPNEKCNEIITPSTTYIEEKMSAQIQVKDIQTATKWDDIDRDSSSDSNESIRL